MKEPARRFEYLDWLRGIAAVAVLVYHARLLLFRDWGAGGAEGGRLAQMFYFATGFGHLAVVVFFVLSGCVIANVVFPRLEEGRWSWPDYSVSRLARFMAVLVPGLCMTLVWDSLAWGLFPDSLPHTSARYANLLTPLDGQYLGPLVFAGNLFSLQTILVPCYGSNGALWSLACEFWYYLIFPALVLLFFPSGRSVWVRLTGAVGATVVMLWIGGETVRLFGVWLMGVGGYVCWRRFPLQDRWLLRVGTLITLAVVVVTLSFIRVRATREAMPAADFVAGAVVAVLVYFLLGQAPRSGGRINQVMRKLADISFTLYVVHTPVLVFIASFAMNSRTERWPLAPQYVGCYLAIVLAVILYAWLMAAIGEARTSRVRAIILRALGLNRPTPVAGATRQPGP